ncbi:MAG: MATE family efflux transporter [Sphingomonadales bacterium]
MAPSSLPSLQFENSRRQIIRMALPISMAIFIPQLNFVINNIFLGHYLKDSMALAVAGITGVYYLIFAAIGYGLNNGLQTLIARRAGENRPEEIGKLFTQGIWVGLALAAVGIAATYLLTPYVFSLILRDPLVLQKALDFLQIRIWGLVFLYVYQLRNALLVGTNQSRYLVAGTLAETVANVLFDYLFIFGVAGFPELGFEGAAYASVLAEFIGMFVIYIVIRYKGIAQRFKLFNDLSFSSENNKLILSVSAPLMFQHAISIISWQYFFLLIEHHGAMAMKVSNIMRNIFGLFGCFSWAFAATTNAMVSNLIGQGKQDEVIPLIKKIIQLSAGSILIIAILLNLFPQPFIALFGQDQAFTEASVPVLRVVSLALLMMSFSTVMLNTVTASGNTRITFYIEALSILFYCAYVYVTCEYFFLPITYGWMSEWLYWICLFTPSFLYVQSGRWKNKKI